MVPRAVLLDSLDTDTQNLQLLPDDKLSHLPAQVIQRTKQQSSVGGGRKGVKTDTLAPIKGLQHAAYGSEDVSGSLDKQQPLSLNLG